ncbi:T9SS sorting signal type C domain-containing protein [Flavobacterium pallidum]|uniref:Secretion system C-terminal sorting domain-containing protein n=1 Tax=Flavobacterium pallidum TaxID=2172098 RepID=A0A2S1SJG2_9FLAO|nr:T9SS sorting signal type C domain-containing protein [Flavobacterium pallidum]AWI26482.1 hypothetical protein HYN49_11535 [Flavobacterium pallidum]
MKKNLQHFRFAILTLAICCLQQVRAQSAGFDSSFIVLSINNGSNIYYDLQASSGNPDFNGANLGTFCEGSSNLVFRGAEHNVYKCGGCDLSSTRLYYRVYPAGLPSGSFTSNNIGYAAGGSNGCGGANQQWADTGYSTNLLSGLAPGNYTIEVYSDATVTCSGGSVYAGNDGNNYKANFTVSGYVTYYADSDNDGFGNYYSQQSSCMGMPVGYASNAADCNDNQKQYTDADGDGFGSTTFAACGVTNNADCNDNQIQYLDGDADGFGANVWVACGVTNNSDCNDNQFQYLDADGDGYGSTTKVACGVTNSVDCNDNQWQYLDADGDTFGANILVACGVTNNSDCNDNQIQYLDADGDGFGSTIQVACGLTNNYDCNDNQLQYLDSDGDGFGANVLVACGLTNNSDCNDNQIQYLDADGDGFGSTIQVACGLTNNYDCNDNQLQYLDSDGDGFGANVLVACGLTNNSDCNDNQIQYLDADGDGFGSTIQVACGLSNHLDCNDNQLQYLDADGDGFGANVIVACGLTNNSDCNDNQIQYLDADGDGFGSTIQVACGLTNNYDCNDNQLQYLDADGDGFGANVLVACGLTNNSDCNDNQIQYLDADGDGFGSTIQVACGLSNHLDCNDNQLQYLDSDGDGFGANVIVACGLTNNSDCNDNQIQYSDADGDGFGSDIQVACGLSNSLDCDDNQLQYLDADGDGFGANILVACGVFNNSDCNDNQIQYLDADGDGFGSDIQVACGLSNSLDCDDNQLQYLDADGDGFGANVIVACGVFNNSDCNDNQIQYLDADGDGFGSTTQVACGLTNNIDCNDNQNQYLDADGDGFGANVLVACGVTNNSDCNDNQLRYADSDGDGYGSMLKVSCGGVPDNTDCNDGDMLVWQSNPLYIDIDGDGYDGGTEIVCYGAIVPASYMETTSGADCDDNNSNVNPGEFEILDNGIDDDCNGMTDAVPYCTVATIWNGSAWTNNYPVADQPAIISGNFAASADLQACSLTITNNAQVIVAGGSDFKITGAVHVDSGSSLTFESNANLVQVDNAANTGNILIKRNTTMRRLDYTYWSSPVAGQNLLAFSPQTVTNRFMTIDETTNAFVTQNPSIASFTAAKGYVIRAPNNFTTAPSPFVGKFTGVPNNGDFTIPVTKNGQGYNLIGNPYPSTLDANAFLAENPGTLYFWTHRNQDAGSGENYSTYTVIGGTASASGSIEPNGTIQVGQGFILLPTAAGNVSFSNDMRAGNNQNQFFRSADIEKHRIWFNLFHGETPSNQIMVAYATDATQDVDAGMDALMVPSNDSFISNLINGGDYVIQARALPFENTDEVPLSFNASEAGTYTLSLDHFDGLFSSNQEIYIKDNLNGIVHDMRQSAYSFASAAGNFTNRFSIVYQNAPLTTQNQILNVNSIVVFKNNEMLTINSGNAQMLNVKIFDIRGRLIAEKNNINSNSTIIDELKAEKQILLVQITDTNNNSVTKKVVY